MSNTIKYILMIIIILFVCSVTCGQDIRVYNSNSLSGHSLDWDYRHRYRTRPYIIQPRYYGPIFTSPGHLYAMHRASGRAARQRRHVEIWTVKRTERIEARYRNYQRIANRTGYDPGGPTKLDEYYGN